MQKSKQLSELKQKTSINVSPISKVSSSSGANMRERQIMGEKKWKNLYGPKIVFSILFIFAFTFCQAQNKLVGTTWLSSQANPGYGENSKMEWSIKFVDASFATQILTDGGAVVQVINKLPYQMVRDTVKIYYTKETGTPIYSDKPNVHLLSKDGKTMKNINMQVLPSLAWKKK